jgi:hypothetical protein
VGLETLIFNSPFVTGIILLFSLMVGMAIMGLPVEIAALIGVPFTFLIVGYYVPALTPILALIGGLFIGFMFLKIVRH